MTLRFRFALALLCAAAPATAMSEDLPPSLTFPVPSTTGSTWVYAVYDPPVICAGMCPDWKVFQGPLDEISAWQTHREECPWRSRSFEEPTNWERKWFLRGPIGEVLPRFIVRSVLPVPNGILQQSVWHLRVRRVPGSHHGGMSRLLDVLEWKAVPPVRICRSPPFSMDDVTHASPTGKGAVVVQAGRTKGMSWVVITGPDPSFVMDVAWVAAPDDWVGPFQVAWNAAGDEATVSLEGRARLRVRWQTRSTTLIAPDTEECAAMSEVARLSLRDPGWSAVTVSALEP